MHHHCPSPFYHSESRSHHRAASRADSGNGNSPGIAQAQGNLLEAVPASIQGPVGNLPGLMENDKWIVALCPTRDLSSVIGHLSFVIFLEVADSAEILFSGRPCPKGRR